MQKQQEMQTKVACRLLFSLKDYPGALDDCLKVCRKHDVSLSHIESRPSSDSNFDFDFMVEFRTENGVSILAKQDELATDLRSQGIKVQPVGGNAVGSVPWFPMRKKDLDQQAHACYSAGSELDADHPGFTDASYRARRREICDLAQAYRAGQPLPRIHYNAEEVATWGKVYEELTALYPTHACAAFNRCFKLLQEHAGYGPTNIPQLEDVSNYIFDCTGFSLRPVTGLLSPREFLNGLAFRVFHSTQYIRHHSKPFYTPEPDVCHELLGHVPLFADRDFAEFSQEIGLASLGASDEDIERLATTYWFTVEFGLCREGGGLRAYGAGLLSSFGELRYSLGGDESQKPEYASFNPQDASVTKYPITKYQPKYFVADSFKRAKDQLKHFSHSIKRPFVPRYDPYSQSIELITTPGDLEQVLHTVRGELAVLEHALKHHGR